MPSLRRLLQRAAAARSLAGGAAEAMSGDADWIIGNVIVEQIAQVQTLARTAR